MVVRRPLLLLLMLVCTALASVRALAQNPNGLIQSDQWACVVPLQGNDCSGGGPGTMLGNWVAPHDVTTENPVEGTVWGDIDFGGEALSVAWLGVGDPTFVLIGQGADPDAIDYQEYLAGAGLTNDFVLGIAVTYVENSTGEALPIGVCTTSDDSIQVWINDRCVVNQSICRGSSGDCDEITPAVLASGVNRITTLVWEGFGGFGFRLGLTRPDGSRYTDADGEIAFLGPFDAAGVVTPPPGLSRSFDGSDHDCPDDRHVVSLTGDGSFDGGATYRVVEELRDPSLSVDDISGVSHAGTVEEILPPPPPPPPPSPVGEFQDHRVIGDAPCPEGNDTVFDDGDYTSISRTGGDMWDGGDQFEFAYSLVDGDFDLSIAFDDRLHSTGAGRWGKFGLIARWTLDDNSRFTAMQDHLPLVEDDPGRLAARTTHRLGPPTAGLFEDVIAGQVSNHPLCYRLTRRGSEIQGWASDSQDLADGLLDPADDANWVQIGRVDDWGSRAPEVAYVGFHNSEHHSDGCAVQEVTFRLLEFEAMVVGLDDVRVGATDLEPVGEFADHTVVGGVACGPGSTTALDGPVYESVAETGGDIWNDGDRFEFAYNVVEGEFDMSIAFVDRLHSNDLGRWGKFGVMARWSLAHTSRFTALQDHLPLLAADDPARLAGRVTHHAGPPTEGLYEDLVPSTLSAHPLCFRLTRRGNSVDAWASDDVALAEGDLDPGDDANWTRVGRSDDWGAAAPSRCFLGFANSEHNSDGCAQQSVFFEILNLDAEIVQLDVAQSEGIRIRWDASGAVLDGEGLGYTIESSRGLSHPVQGYAEGAATKGPDRYYFQDARSGPIGAFDDSHDIGSGGPCTAGRFSVEENGPGIEDDVYTIEASGLDIWVGGDQFHFAHREMTGDFVADVRIVDIVHAPSGGRWGKSGLMARWDCGPLASYAFAHTAGATDFECSIDGPRLAFRANSRPNDIVVDQNWLLWQDVFGDEPTLDICGIQNSDPRSGDLRGGELNIPEWLRLVRRGNTFYGYASADGDDWRILGAYTRTNVPETVLVGFASTGHAGCDLQRVVFDRFRCEPASALESALEDDAGPGGLDGEIVYSADFDEATEGSLPDDVRANAWGVGQFEPQVSGDRLRLGDIRNSPLGSGEDRATAVLFSQTLSTSEAYAFDFDAYFSYDQGLAGDGNPPADGMTFTVLGVEEVDRRVSEPEAVGEFVRETVGPACSRESTTTHDDGVGIYTTSARNGGDIWGGGDSFEFAFKRVEGDFDIAVEITDRRFPSVGRWGKFGVMVRQTLDFNSKYGMLQDHGPDLQDPARYAQRIQHLNTGNVAEPAIAQVFDVDPNDGSSLLHPRFMRLTRRAGLVEAWVSNTAGDEGFDPGADESWYPLFAEDWSLSPDAVYLGFAYSVHNSSGCEAGEIDWELVRFVGDELPIQDPGDPADPFGIERRAGDRGGGIGYNRITLSLSETSIRSMDFARNSFSIELDNWHGNEVENDGSGGNVTGWDPAGGRTGSGTGTYHIALNANASTFSAQRNHEVGVHDFDLPDIYDPEGMHVRVLYDGGRVKTWVAQNVAGEPPSDEDLVLVTDYEIEPLDLNASRALFGFTSATGGATCTMEIDNVVVRQLTGERPGQRFVRGDVNGDGAIVISDAIALLGFLFIGGPAPECLDAADVDNSGGPLPLLTDAVNLLNWLFRGGEAPQPPSPSGTAYTSADCGLDTATPADTMECEAFSPCD